MHLGKRIEQKDSLVSANTRRYYYNNNWQVLCEYDGSDNFKCWYAYGNYIDEVLMMSTNASGLPPVTKFFIHDHLCSPAALAAFGGNVIERYEYDVYGNCHVLEPNFADDPDGQSDYGNPYLFTGRRVDILDYGSLKIQYNRNRYYDQYTGRWLTHDPLGVTPNPQRPNHFNAIWQYKDGQCLYEYVRSNPVNKLDQLGLYGPMPFTDPLLLECQCRSIFGFSPYDPYECKWLLIDYSYIEYPIHCDDDVEDKYCESVLSGTTKFVCKDLELIENDVERTKCYYKVMVTEKIKIYMMSYICTHLNTWRKTEESFSHERTKSVFVKECAKRRVYYAPYSSCRIRRIGT